MESKTTPKNPISLGQRAEDDKIIIQLESTLKGVIKSAEQLASSLQKYFTVTFEELIAKLKKEASYTLKRARARLQDEKGNSKYEFTFHNLPLDFKPQNLKGELTKVIAQIQETINTKTNEYLDALIQHNIMRNNSTSILHMSNRISSINYDWYSVTSRDVLRKVQVVVEGFDDIQTTFIAIGVSDKQKNYGKCMAPSLAKEGFVGCIYLNGKANQDEYTKNSNYKQSSIPKSEVQFFVQDKQRKLIIERGDTKKREELLLQDNVKYYLYLAWKGPISFNVQ